MIFNHTKAWRVSVAVAFGMIGFAINFLDFQLLESTNLKISILVGLLLPLLVALAWGWRYGLLASLAGGCQSMWWLWRDDGWGVLYAVPIYTLWIVWHGWWADRRREGHVLRQSCFIVEIPFRLFSELGFYTIFRWLVSFNPPPWNPTATWDFVQLPWVHTVALKHTVTAYVLLLMAYVLMNIGPVRRFFGLAIRPAQHETNIILAVAVLVGLGLWTADGIVNYLAFNPADKSFWACVVLDPGGHETFMRILFVLVSLLSGAFVARAFRHRIFMNQRLVRLNKELKAIRGINQLIIHEKDSGRLLQNACQHLVDSEGFFNAWIAIFQENGQNIESFNAGLNGGSRLMALQLAAGQTPECAKRAMAQPGVHVVTDVPAQCLDCPMALEHSGHAAFAVRLAHQDRMFGWLCVSASQSAAQDPADKELISDVADDLSFALWSIETKASRERTERRYGEIMAAIGDAVVVTDMDNRITMFNPGAERLFALPADKALGSSLHHLCPADLHSEQHELMARVRLQGAIQGYETRRLTATGDEVAVEMTLNLFNDGHGNPLGIIAVLRDITTRLKAREKIRRSQIMLARTEELARVGSWEWCVHTDNVTWSDGLYRIYEQDPASAPLSFTEQLRLYTPESMESLRQAMLQAAEEGSSFSLELECVRSNGEVFPCLAHGHPEFGLDDRVEMVHGFLQDISELKEAENRFKLAFQTSPDAININRLSDGMYVDINQGFTDIMGFARKDVIGKTSLELNIWDNPDDRAELVRGLQEQGRYNNLEAQFRLANDSVTIGLMSASVIHLNGVPHILSVTRDIGQMRKMEQERVRLKDSLRQTQKMEAVGRLAGGVAHDLNNLLSPIIGYSEMALEETTLADPCSEYINQILKAGMRARDLVRQLLAFGRKQALDTRLLDMSEAIQGFRKLLRRTIREDVEMVFSLAPDLPPIRADLGQMEQVIMNLVVNAQDAMPKGGVMTIETALVELDSEYSQSLYGVEPGHYVLLAISDDGCGMDEDVRLRVFEPFFTTKGKEYGTGLGLSTVYGIVKQHGGNIWVYSELGEGTVFKVYLPVADPDPFSDASIKPALTGDMRGTETVLLVEDDQDVRDLAIRALQRQGYKVLAASDGQAAHELLKEHDGQINLLLTDVIMPGLNGKELAEQISRWRPGLAVLYISGYTDNIIAQHGVLEQGVHFLQKPFSIKELTSKVREVLNASNSER